VTRGEAKEVIRKGLRWDLGWASATLACLLYVIAAKLHPSGSHAWQRAAGFLLVSTVAATVAVVADVLLIRLARQHDRREVEANVRFRRPTWIGVGEYAPFVSLGAVLSAMASACDWPKIGVCIFAVGVALFVFASVLDAVLGIANLAFEPAGLRLYAGHASFVVPWNDIGRIDIQGPTLYRSIVVHISDRQSVIRTVQPATEGARNRVTAVVVSEGRGAWMLLNPWIGGLDGAALMRAIQDKAARSKAG
jgi:hypothetical protein